MFFGHFGLTVTVGVENPAGGTVQGVMLLGAQVMLKDAVTVFAPSPIARNVTVAELDEGE